MKYVKILGLLAVAAAALMAFAASASATTVTGPNGETTPTIHAVSEEKAVEETNHVLLHNSIANIECNSTVKGTVATHGTGVTASGSISELSFSNCTGGWAIDVVSNGTLEIHNTSITGHGAGTLTSSGATVVATRFGVSCGYQTNNTHIGTVTGGNPATLHIEASIPRHSGSFLCGGSNANWTGAYKTSETLKIDA